MMENASEATAKTVEFVENSILAATCVDSINCSPREQCNNGSDATPIDSEKHISKSQMKKQKKKELWLSRKVEKRSLQKEKKKEKRKLKVERGEDLGLTKKRLKKNTMQNSQCRIRVAIDCSFDDLMADKDINKLGQQIQYCYSNNRRAVEPLQFYLTGLGSKSQSRLDRIGDYHGWDVNVHHESYLQVFESGSIVYLTSDSPNVLETLEPDKAYIIGGLVDHNHHKSLCYDQAVQNSIGHARLPISEYIQLSTRNVLTVNHVFEILLRYTESGNWKDAFFKVIPKRKQTGQGRCKGVVHGHYNGEEDLNSDKCGVVVVDDTETGSNPFQEESSSDNIDDVDCCSRDGMSSCQENDTNNDS